VTISDIPDNKPNAIDRALISGIDKFEVVHSDGTALVLISGDIDFIQKLHHLRHAKKFEIVVYHNKQSRSEMKQCASKSFEWDSFANKSPKLQKANSQANENKQRRNRERTNNSRSSKYKCITCSKPYRSPSSFVAHFSSDSHWKCTFCDKTFTSPSSLEQHFEAKDHWSCEFCGMKLNSEKQYRNHQDSSHVEIMQLFTVNGEDDSDEEDESDEEDLIQTSMNAIQQLIQSTSLQAPRQQPQPPPPINQPKQIPPVEQVKNPVQQPKFEKPVQQTQVVSAPSPKPEIKEEWVYIMSQHNPQLCLDIYGGSPKAGTSLIVWTYHGGDNQKFRFHQGMLHCKNGQVVDIEGGIIKGNKLIQWPAHGGANQKWKYQNGLIVLENNALCFNIFQAQKKEGTQVIAWTLTGDSNQKWSLVKCT